jgi:predicted TIM-barrel fold metal-dependent hydrolase
MLMEPSEIFQIPLIDSHCHGFLPEKETKDFETYLTLSMLEIPIEDIRNLFLYRRIIHELARILECKPAQTLKKRNELYTKHPVNYIKSLFEDAKIQLLLVDTGYPFEMTAGYSVDLDTFEKIVPCRLQEIWRYDTAWYPLMSQDVSFQQFMDLFIDEATKAVKQDEAKAIKSAMAPYYSGLEFTKVTEKEAEKAFRAVHLRSDLLQILRQTPQIIKPLMDYLMFSIAGLCGELSVPLQIHVGMGDSPSCDLRKSNPILMYEFINDEATKKTKLIFTHTGYPYIEEAGFLANQYPNVYLDISEMTPFISFGIRDKLFRLLEMCPTNKLLYGSDGHNIPELFWISALETRYALHEVIQHFATKKVVEDKWLDNIPHQIFADNAKRVYNLDF